MVSHVKKYFFKICEIRKIKDPQNFSVAKFFHSFFTVWFSIVYQLASGATFDGSTISV